MNPEDISVIRSLIPDDAPVFDGDYMLSDAQIGHYYTAGGSVLRAAALACLAIAASEAIISKKIGTQDLQTDGAAVARALIEKSKMLFERADAEDNALIDSYFEVIDYGWGFGGPELTEREWHL